MRINRRVISILLILLLSLQPLAWAEEEPAQSSPSSEVENLPLIITPEGPTGAAVISEESSDDTPFGEYTDFSVPEEQPEDSLEEFPSEVDGEATEEPEPDSEPQLESLQENSSEHAPETVSDSNPEAEPANPNDAAASSVPAEELSDPESNALTNADIANLDASSDKSGFSDASGTQPSPVSSGAPAPVEGLNIASIRVEPDAHNSDYSFLSFSFSSQDDPTMYYGYVTGLMISSTWDSNKYLKLVSDIACCFYQNQPFSISNSTYFVDAYGLNIKPIDAEKQIYNAGSTSETPDAGDSNLCWAASDANMLQYSGWVPDDSPLSTEDALMKYYTEHFTNGSSTQDTGSKWIFDGVNPKQNLDGRETYSAAQVKDSGTNNGLLNDYAEENYESYSAVKDSGIDAFSDTVKSMRAKGSAIGIGIDYYGDDTGTRYGSHALTVFGFIMDTIHKGIDSLRAIFVSDSDNSMQRENTGNVVDASKLVDSVTMYTLSDKTVGAGSVLETSQLNNYGGSAGTETVTAVIMDYTVLDPPSATAHKETVGTRDAVNTIDITVKSTEARSQTFSPVNTVKDGDQIYLWATVKNVSYQKLDASRNPILAGDFLIYRNGQLVDRLNADVELTENQLLQMYNLVIELPYQVSGAGSYTIGYVINGIRYGDGTPVQEAYTLNNNVKNAGTFLVPGQVSPSTPTEKDYGMNTGIIKADKYPTFTAQFDTSGDLTDREFYIPFMLDELGMAKGLYNGDILIPQSCFDIRLMQDGMFRLYFTPEYVSTLFKGYYIYTLMGQDDKPMAVFIVEVI